MSATVNIEQCTGCNACMSACPVEAICLVDDLAKVLDDCIECGTCIDECPTQAILME